jgi:RNA polymerase sigma factor (sigma-70 family)
MEPRERERVAALVRSAQAGNERSFAELVRGFQDIVVAFATARLGDYHLGEDAAQEAFVDAYRHLGSVRSPEAFSSWLQTIIVKQCDRITRRKQHSTIALDYALGLASTDPSPHDIVERCETEHALCTAIATLSDAEREAVVLYYMGERSHAEVAEFLGVTNNVVKTRVYSARQRLRKHMSDIEKRLGDARPSRSDVFAKKIERLIQPEALRQKKPWMWSPGIGTDVWALFCACITGDLETVERLVTKDPSLVRAHYEYRTGLSFAVRENHPAVVRFLLDHGADPLMFGDLLEVARERGYAEVVEILEASLARLGASAKGEAVAAAIRSGDMGAVRRLLDESPELIHEGDARSNQPIHWATMTRQLEMIDEVLVRGADINARRQDGALPIHLTNGDYHYRGWRDVPARIQTTPDEVYRHLVSRGADVDIGMAAAKGDMTRVRALLDRDPSLANGVSEYGSYYVGCGAPIKNAVISGDIEIVKLLLERGADPNRPEEGIAPRGHALYTAVSRRHYDVAKLLLEHGAYPNPPVESSADAVSIAIMNGDRRMLELLGSYGAEWEIDMGPGRTNLSYADIVATGVHRSVKMLAAQGDVAAATAAFEAAPALANDPEALGNAASHRHVDFVRLMLRYHPDVAKHVTVSRPREIAQLLFEYGMNPSLPNWLRITPLHHFAQNGDVESAALFLDHGADIDARDEEWYATPLGWAARANQRRTVEFLLRRGARLMLPDDPPWATPLAIATRRGHESIVHVLTEYANTGELPPRRLASFEAIAADLVDVFRNGAEDALQRLVDVFQVVRPVTWDRPPIAEQVARLRGFVRERLGKPSKTHGDDTLALDDAKALIARAHGYEDWKDLENDVGG